MVFWRSTPVYLLLSLLLGGCPFTMPPSISKPAQLQPSANQAIPGAAGPEAPTPQSGVTPFIPAKGPGTVPVPDPGPTPSSVSTTTSTTSTTTVAPPTIGISATLTTPLLRSGNLPQTVAAGGSPGLADVDATNLYVIDGAGTTFGAAGTTLKVQPLNGNPAVTLATAPIVCFCRVGTALYYATATTIDTISTTGTGAAPVMVGQTDIRAIAADATHVYYLSGGSGLGDGSLKSVPVGGGGVTTLAGGLTDPRGLAIDGTNAYFADRGSGNNGTIKKVPLGGGAVTILASNQPAPWSVTVDASTVYFANAPAGSGDVRKVAIAGGATTVLVSGLTASQPLLTVDGTHLYYLEGNAPASAATAGSVRRVPIGGGAAFLMATGLNHPMGLALDAGNVYYALPSTASALQKVTK